MVMTVMAEVDMVVAMVTVTEAVAMMVAMVEVATAVEVTAVVVLEVDMEVCMNLHTWNQFTLLVLTHISHIANPAFEILSLETLLMTDAGTKCRFTPRFPRILESPWIFPSTSGCLEILEISCQLKYDNMPITEPNLVTSLNPRNCHLTMFCAVLFILLYITESVCVCIPCCNASEANIMGQYRLQGDTGPGPLITTYFVRC